MNRKPRASRRPWFKAHTDGLLRGTLRTGYRHDPMLGSLVRDVFVTGLLPMAADSAFGNEGLIAVSEDVGFTDDQLAGMLVIPLEKWLAAKMELAKPKRRTERRIKIIKAKVGFHIQILHWRDYQPDFFRQRKYRKKKQLEEELRLELLEEGKTEDKYLRVTPVLTERGKRGKGNGFETAARVFEGLVDAKRKSEEGENEQDVQ